VHRSGYGEANESYACWSSSVSLFKREKKSRCTRRLVFGRHIEVVARLQSNERWLTVDVKHDIRSSMSDDDEFIARAREQDCNCLDLSKREIGQFPSMLLDFPSLQVNRMTLFNIIELAGTRSVFVS
jgi:hypothetical protein